jgi:hypothetical protein
MLRPPYPPTTNVEKAECMNLTDNLDKAGVIPFGIRASVLKTSTLSRIPSGFYWLLNDNFEVDVEVNAV